MATRKNNTKLPRFRIERMDDQFLILDSVEGKYEVFASRQAAELECAARNGTGRQKTTETLAHQQFRDKFREKGVTFEDIDADDQTRDRANARLRQPDHLRPLMDQRAQRAAADYRNWLPPVLS